jgi:RimJ/RimL family protein N-acetyltransferase
MMQRLNEFSQPIGPELTAWKPPPVPPRTSIEGRFCRLDPLDLDRHARDLYAVNSLDRGGRSWTYLPYGPFASLDSYCTWIASSCLSDDPLFFAIVDKASGKPLGVASYLRIAPSSGSIEVGHIHYSQELKRTLMGTESMFLMMQTVFNLGYRRYEWKCDALNAGSMIAAQRLGFSFEGIFRQASVYKGRNRDTAWFSVIDTEWPSLREAFLTWLHPDNFDGRGRQKTRLTDLTRPLLKQSP